jgi:Ferredoxin-like domain in Api92-like protein
MTNECRHRMKVEGDPAEVEHLFAEIRGLPGTDNELMDLQAIVPIPVEIDRILKLNSLDVIREASRNEQTFAEYQKRLEAARSAAWLAIGCESWDEWAQAEWGSRSNVYFVEPDANEADTLCFSSAWSPVIPALLALSRAFPAVTIKISYAEEGGFFLGQGELKGGEKNIRKYSIKTREGRDLYAEFWGEWPGRETDDDVVDLIDQTHRTAS